jgi:hypothetical protein
MVELVMQLLVLQVLRLGLAEAVAAEVAAEQPLLQLDLLVALEQLVQLEAMVK